MKSKLLALLFLLLWLPTSYVAGQGTTYNACFIGNSYTSYNNLPDLVAALASANGDSLYQVKYTVGGYTLQQHSTNTTTNNIIAGGNIFSQTPWDFVIFQEQSQLPSFPDWQVQQQVFPYATTLVDTARASNPCVEPVFFMTWGRKNGDQMNCANFPPICTYDGMQERLRNSYLQMGADNNATVAPVGAAWKVAIDSGYVPDLFAADGSHPSAHGSYLAACVFYATLFQKSPVGNSYTYTLPAADAAMLQSWAHLVVLDSLDNWYINANKVHAAWSASTNGLNAVFTDSSTNATNWLWDFGDGTSSNVQHPSHSYASNGLYTVTLIATDSCSSDTIEQQINLNCTGPTAGFTSNSNQLTVSFSDVSTGASSVQWLFGDGTTGTGSNVSHQYQQEGTYEVCLIASNSCADDTLCSMVTVTCPAPITGFTFSANELSVSFINTTANGAGYSWDFGDGFTGSGSQQAHNYPMAGTYEVCLTATNSCGSTTYCDSITVSCPGPTASFIYSDSLLEVAFSSTSADATAWSWAFGDGGTSNQQNPSHNFDSSGTYQVVLVVTSPCGSDSAFATVTIQSPPNTGLSMIGQVDAALQIVPNPANSRATVRLPQGKRIRTIEAYDSAGKLVETFIVSGNQQQVQLSLESLPTGTYLLVAGSQTATLIISR